MGRSGGATPAQTIGNIVVSIVGTGVLGLPYAFRTAGWIAGAAASLAPGPPPSIACASAGAVEATIGIRVLIAKWLPLCHQHQPHARTGAPSISSTPHHRPHSGNASAPCHRRLADTPPSTAAASGSGARMLAGASAETGFDIGGSRPESTTRTPAVLLRAASPLSACLASWPRHDGGRPRRVGRNAPRRFPALGVPRPGRATIASPRLQSRSDAC
nr:unnamed protein product [Digitaria exilis]